MELKDKRVKDMLLDDAVDFDGFYNYLREHDIGNWDNVNSDITIKRYVVEMMKQDIPVAHILTAMENNKSDHDLYMIWLGNSMETPEPIDTKRGLFNALS